MKNPNMSFPLIFLSIVLAVVSAPCAVQGQGAVLDTKGRPVHPGSYYYVLPAEDGNGGGLRAESKASFHPPCPVGVIQSQYPDSLGQAVIITPWNGAVGFLPSSTNVTIEFDSITVGCPRSSMWTSVFSPWLRGNYVSTGGDIGSDDIWFKIVKDGNGYKIVHSLSSEEVGIFEDHFADVRAVVVGGVTPLKFKFQLAYVPRHEPLKKTE